MSEGQFPPSIRRLQKLRKDGKVIKTQWVTLACGYWAVVLAMPLTLSWVGDGTLLQWGGYKVWAPGIAFSEALVAGGRAVALPLAALAFGAVAAEVAQTRGLFLPSLLLKGFHRYRPGSYLSRVKQGLVDVSLGLLRCAVLFIAVLPVFVVMLAQSGSAIGLDGEQVSGVLSNLVWSVALRAGAVLALVAAVAYAVVRWRFFRENRMSLHDVREEHKESEGDPHLKSARKHEHRVLLMAELERRVKRSKVIVVRRAPSPNGPSSNGA